MTKLVMFFAVYGIGHAIGMTIGAILAWLASDIQMGGARYSLIDRVKDWLEHKRMERIARDATEWTNE